MHWDETAVQTRLKTMAAAAGIGSVTVVITYDTPIARVAAAATVAAAAAAELCAVW